MSTPPIKTKFQLDGEKEYKNSITSINSGLGVLNSEMKKTQAEFKDSANSTEALSKKSDVLGRTLLSQKDKVAELRKAHENAAKTFGESDRRTQNWAKSLNNAEAAVFETERAVKENDAALKKATQSTDNYSDANNKSDASSRGLGTTIDGLAGKFGISLPNGITKSLDSLVKLSGKTILMVAGFAAAAAAIVTVEKKLIDLTKQAAETADEIMTLSYQTSLSVDTIQELQYAAELIDVPFETLQSSMSKMVRTMASAKNGSAEAQAAFEALGVSVTDNNGELRDSEDVFNDAVNALGNVGNETERDAIAMQLFGRSAQDLNPLIVQGTDVLGKYRQEAHDTGYVLDTEMLESLGAVDDSYQRMQRSQEGVTNQLAAKFAPSMTKVFEDCKAFIEKVGKAMKESGLIEAFGSILKSVGSLLAPLGNLIEKILPALKIVLDPIASVIALIADTLSVIVGIFTLDWDLISTGLGIGISNGKMSSQQNMANRNSSSVWDPVLGSWVGNGAYNASGTDNWRGGMTWVGENGPEQVYLPSGARVATAQESRRTGGDIYNINIDAKNVKEFNDIVRIAKNERITTRMGYTGG